MEVTDKSRYMQWAQVCADAKVSSPPGYWLDDCPWEEVRTLWHGKRVVAWLNSKEDKVEWALDDSGYVESEREDLVAALEALDRAKKERTGEA